MSASDNPDSALDSSQKTKIAESRLLESFIATQQGELDLRKRELDLRAKENQAADDYAHASLKAIAEDRKQYRSSLRLLVREGYFFVAAIAILTFIVIIVAICYGKADLVEQTISSIVESITKIAVGALATFAYMKKSESDKKAKSENEIDL